MYRKTYMVETVPSLAKKTKSSKCNPWQERDAMQITQQIKQGQYARFYR